MANPTPNGLSKGTRHDKEKTLGIIMEGMKLGKPILTILRENKGMPCAVTVYDWIKEDEIFSRTFEKLREVGADAMATECLEIADRKCETMVEVQHRRLMVDTRLRLLAKWQPKKYGDKLELSGSVETTLSPLEQLRQIHGARNGGLASPSNGLDGGLIVDAQMVESSSMSPDGELDSKLGKLAKRTSNRQEVRGENIQPPRSEGLASQAPETSEIATEEDCF